MSETTNEATTETAGETSADNEGAATSAEATSEEVDWKAKFEAQQKIARDLEKKVKGEAGSLKQQLDALQAKMDGKEAEHQASIEAQRIKDEALAAANERIVSAELRAAAKGKVADDVLSDLSFFIKPSAFEVGDDGSVDTDAIARAVDDLIKNKPSLAAQGKRFQGSADGGARKDAATVGQLTEADVKRLSSEGKHEEIVKAREEGRLRDYLASP